MVELNAVVDFWDDLLRIAEVKDFPNAFNGLQLENPGSVTKIAAAVDAAEAVIDAAVAVGADLLLVHHGMLWGGAAPLRGPVYRKWYRAISAGLAVYSAHLPLDAHPEFGNNVRLCRALRFGDGEPFFDELGTPIGRRVEVDLPRDELMLRVTSAVDGGPVGLAPGGPATVRQLGIVTGGAGSQIATAAKLGVDTFLTGEGPHWTYTLAEELGVNLIYAGHYATETFGVKALAAATSARFGVPWEFIDHPTGR